MPPVPTHRSRVGSSWLPARWMLGTVYHYVRCCGWTSDAVTEEPDSGYCRVRVHRYEGREQAKPACAVRSGEETVTGRDTRGLPGWALFLHLDAVGCVCSVCENAGRCDTCGFRNRSYISALSKNAGPLHKCLCVSVAGWGGAPQHKMHPRPNPQNLIWKKRYLQM